MAVAFSMLDESDLMVADRTAFREAAVQTIPPKHTHTHTHTHTHNTIPCGCMQPIKSLSEVAATFSHQPEVSHLHMHCTMKVRWLLALLTILHPAHLQHASGERSAETSWHGSESGRYSVSPSNASGQSSLQRQFSGSARSMHPHQHAGGGYDAYNVSAAASPTTGAYGAHMAYAYPPSMTPGYTMAGGNMYIPMPGYGVPVAPGMYPMTAGFSGYAPRMMGMVPQESSTQGMVTMIGQDGMAYAVSQSAMAMTQAMMDPQGAYQQVYDKHVGMGGVAGTGGYSTGAPHGSQGPGGKNQRSGSHSKGPQQGGRGMGSGLATQQMGPRLQGGMGAPGGRGQQAGAAYGGGGASRGQKMAQGQHVQHQQQPHLQQQQQLQLQQIQQHQQQLQHLQQHQQQMYVAQQYSQMADAQSIAASRQQGGMHGGGAHQGMMKTLKGEHTQKHQTAAPPAHPAVGNRDSKNGSEPSMAAAAQQQSSRPMSRVKPVAAGANDSAAQVPTPALPAEPRAARREQSAEPVVRSAGQRLPQQAPVEAQHVPPTQQAVASQQPAAAMPAPEPEATQEEIPEGAAAPGASSNMRVPAQQPLGEQTASCDATEAGVQNESQTRPVEAKMEGLLVSEPGTAPRAAIGNAEATAAAPPFLLLLPCKA
eukprot:363221-Chlamydomonas_euryale.AAC.1